MTKQKYDVVSLFFLVDYVSESVSPIFSALAVWTILPSHHRELPRPEPRPLGTALQSGTLTGAGGESRGCSRFPAYEVSGAGACRWPPWWVGAPPTWSRDTSGAGIFRSWDATSGGTDDQSSGANKSWPIRLVRCYHCCVI